MKGMAREGRGRRKVGGRKVKEGKRKEEGEREGIGGGKAECRREKRGEKKWGER